MAKILIVDDDKQITEMLEKILSVEGFEVISVNDSSQAIQQKLSLGARINDKVVVHQGLKEGDKIITEGFQRLRDSARVNVTMSKQL